MEEKAVNEISPLTWAYIGDAVFELYVREYLVKTSKLKPHKLHLESIKYVKASAQANKLREIEGHFTDDEKEIVRRARNAKNHHLPKNADVNEYMHSTAFEGLIGYLYLARKKGKTKRNFRTFCSKNIYNKQLKENELNETNN